MNDNQLIMEYYESDNESPVKVIDINTSSDYGERYYEVLYTNEEGKHTDIVFVQNGVVLVLPE